MSIQRVLPGLHHGKTALITGGSLGIGLQLGRYLAMAGARVLLAARSSAKLEAARDDIVAELRGVGYARPEDRVLILSGIDVGDEDALQHLYKQTVRLFGELDFLINNAGIAGAEEMVVDMSLDAWNTTMEANLISNYSLIRKVRAAHEGARLRRDTQRVELLRRRKIRIGGLSRIAPTTRCRRPASVRWRKSCHATSARRSRSTQWRPDRWTAPGCAVSVAHPGCSTGAAA